MSKLTTTTTTTTTLKKVSIKVKNLGAVIPKISPGYNFTYALRGDNTNSVVSCAGYNSSYYCCGTGRADSSYKKLQTVKIPLKSGDYVTSISQGCSYHKLFLTKDGKVYGVGYNGNYSQGDGKKTIYKTVKELKFFQNKKVRKVMVGYLCSYVLLQNGELFVFGYSGIDGKLGTGNEDDVKTPQKAKIKGKVKNLAAGVGHTIVSTVSGLVFVAGDNGCGQLGMGNNKSCKTWTKNSFFDNMGIRDVACGYGNYSFFITKMRRVYACGHNLNGVLGIGNTNNSKVLSPKVVSLYHVEKIRCGQYHAAFVLKDGRIYTTGQGSSFQLGNGKRSNYYTPTLLNVSKIPARVVDVFCGLKQTFVVTNQGDVYCLGTSSYGEDLTELTGCKRSFVKTKVTVSIEENEEDASGHKFYMQLIKDKVGSLGKVLEKNKKCFTINFKNRKEELVIPAHVASFLSSEFGTMISKGNLKMKMDESEYFPMTKIIGWTKSKKRSNVITFKTTAELIDVYLTARKWKIVDLVYDICKSIDRIRDMKRIIDILFHLEEKKSNNTSLFHAAKLIFKKNYKTIIVENIGYLVQKKTSNTQTLYSFLLSNIINDRLEKLEDHIDFVNLDSASTSGDTIKKRSKLFGDSAKDFVIECEDGKFILGHKEILSTNPYLLSLMKDSIRPSFLQIDIPSRLMLLIIVAIYNESIDRDDLDELALQEVVDLKFTTKKFGLKNLQILCQNALEKFNWQVVSRGELSKTLLDCQIKMEMMAKKLKECRGRLLKGFKMKKINRSTPTPLLTGSVDPFADQL